MEEEKKEELKDDKKVEEVKQEKQEEKEEKTVEEKTKEKPEEKMEKEDEKVKEDKKQEKVETKEKKKGSKKTKIVIAMIAILVIIASAVGGYFAYQYIEEKKPIEQEWADTYYNFIKGSDEENSSDTKIKNNSKIGFIDVAKIENPVMIVEYEKEEKTYTDIYYINDGKVNNVINLDADNVELLYDINTKQYDWYTHIETETNDTYRKISTQILRKDTEITTEDTATEENTEYTFIKGEEISVETVDGNKIAIPKFDTLFVETEVEVGKVDYHVDMKDKELKTAIIEGVDKYKTEEEMITEQVKTEVTQKVTEVENKQQEMEIAKEEKAKKEEEEMKITAENIQTKIGEHLKWTALAYLGSDYGLPTVYKVNDVSGTVSIPGVDNSYMMTYEIVGLKSIQSLKNQIATYISSSAISKLNQSMWGSYTEGLKEYNGKVYLVRGGIGDGPSIDIKKAKVLSSEGEISKVQLTDINVLGDVVEATITLTVEYNKETGKYMITDCVIKK